VLIFGAHGLPEQVQDEATRRALPEVVPACNHRRLGFAATLAADGAELALTRTDLQEILQGIPLMDIVLGGWPGERDNTSNA